MTRTNALAGLGLAVVAAVAFALALANARPGQTPELATTPNSVVANATVVRGVDGDTLKIEISGITETVRLIGLDTPETVDERRPVQCYGPEASARTEALLPPGTAVRVERDTEARDQYGRLLAYVYRAADGLFVNLELVRDGYGSVLLIAPNMAFAGELRAAEAAARQARLGLWGLCADAKVTAIPSTTR